MCAQGTCTYMDVDISELSWAGWRSCRFCCFHWITWAVGRTLRLPWLTSHHWNFGEERQQMGCFVYIPHCLLMSAHMHCKADRIHNTYWAPSFAKKCAAGVYSSCTALTVQSSWKLGPQRPGMWDMTRQRVTAGNPSCDKPPLPVLHLFGPAGEIFEFASNCLESALLTPLFFSIWLVLSG